MVDFGFAKEARPDRKCLTFCGTPEYLAPEVFLGRGYTSAVDCWALAVLTWEQVAGSLPWASSQKGDKLGRSWSMREIVVYDTLCLHRVIVMQKQ